MGLFSRSKDAVKTYANHVGGTVRNNIDHYETREIRGLIVRQVKELRTTRCPACDAPMDIIKNQSGTSIRACTSCDYTQPHYIDTKTAEYQDLTAIQQAAMDRYNALSDDQIGNLKRNFSLLSRTLYAVASICLIIMLYYMIFSESGSVMLLYLIMAVAAGSNAVRFSYRHWQITNAIFYQPGSFTSWLNSGKWFV